MLAPMLAMVVLTMTVLLMAFLARVRSIKSGEVKMSYYRTFDGATPPDDVIKSTRHYSNLFEMPMLFYVACVLCIVLNMQGLLVQALAWSYVTFRVIHSLIHMGYNDVLHRLYAFAASNACLMALWLFIAIQQFA